VQRLAVRLPFSDWPVWVLNHVNLRKTARAQRCRELALEAPNAKRQTPNAIYLKTSDLFMGA